MSGRGAAVDWLTGTWWFLFPCFAALAVWLTMGRICGNPYDLLPGATSHPAIAWLFASVYVLAHIWILGAYLLTAAAADELLPPVGAFATVWGSHSLKLVLLAAALSLQYVPVQLWRIMGAGLPCSA